MRATTAPTVVAQIKAKTQRFRLARVEQIYLFCQAQKTTKFNELSI